MNFLCRFLSWHCKQMNEGLFLQGKKQGKEGKGDPLTFVFYSIFNDLSVGAAMANRGIHQYPHVPSKGGR